MKCAHRGERTHNNTRSEGAEHRIQPEKCRKHDEGSQQKHSKTQHELTGCVSFYRHNLAQPGHLLQKTMRNNRRHHSNRHEPQQNQNRQARRVRGEQQRHRKNREKLANGTVYQHRITHPSTRRTMGFEHGQQRAQSRGTQRNTHRNIGVKTLGETGDERRPQHAKRKTDKPGCDRAFTLAVTQRIDVNLKPGNQKEHA